MTPPAAVSPEQYQQAFLAIEDRITPAQMAMLQAHYHARGRVITATNLAHAVGYEVYHAANLHYGLLAQMVREQLRLPDTGTELDVLVTFVPPGAQSNAHWLFVMRDDRSQPRGAGRLGRRCIALRIASLDSGWGWPGRSRCWAGCSKEAHHDHRRPAQSQHLALPAPPRL